MTNALFPIDVKLLSVCNVGGESTWLIIRTTIVTMFDSIISCTETDTDADTDRPATDANHLIWYDKDCYLSVTGRRLISCSSNAGTWYFMMCGKVFLFTYDAEEPNWRVVLQYHLDIPIVMSNVKSMDMNIFPYWYWIRNFSRATIEVYYFSMLNCIRKKHGTWVEIRIFVMFYSAHCIVLFSYNNFTQWKIHLSRCTE